jgi:two-component system, sensor histidine kinase
MLHRYNSLRSRVLLIVLLTVIPIFMLVLLSTVEQQQRAINQALEEAQRQAQQIAKDNSQYIDSTHMLLMALAQLPIVREKQVEACNALFADLLQQYELYNGLFVVDTTTNLGICSAIPYSEPIDNSTFPWYQETLESQAFTVSSYRIGPLTGRPILTIGLPVFNDRLELTAVVAATLSLDWLNRFVSTADLPADTSITLFDQTGVVLARYPEVEGITGELWANEQVREAALANGTGWIQTRDSQNTPRIYVYSQTGSSLGQMYIVVGLQEDVALADVQRTLRDYLLGLTAITIIVVALALVSSNLITRPIQGLTETSGRLATGQLDSRPELDTSISELQQLIRAFNQMAAAVEQNMLRQMQQLASTNDQLQQEIRERARLEQRTNILKDFAAGLSEAVEIEQIIRVIVEKGLSPLDVKCSYIALKRSAGDTLTTFSYENGNQEVTEIDLNAEELLPRIYRSGEEIWGGDTADSVAELRLADDETFACLPLMIGQQTLGSILVIFKRSKRNEPDFTDLLHTIMDYSSQALERARLYESEIEARREAEKANQVKVQFFGMISHELRTPLTTIKGFVTTLLAEDIEWPPERVRYFLSVADQEADRLSNLVEQLLELSRIEARSLQIQPGKHTLQEVLQSAEAQLFTLAANHKLSVQLPANLPPVQIDPPRIAQVVVNLVGNAVKFSPPDSPILVSASEQGAFVQVEVSDQGIGIPDSAREYIFEAFRQLDDTQEHSHKGAGLGLAICKAFVELHGGTIWVKGKDSSGTTIAFTIPVSRTTHSDLNTREPYRNSQ